MRSGSAGLEMGTEHSISQLSYAFYIRTSVEIRSAAPQFPNCFLHVDIDNPTRFLGFLGSAQQTK